MPQEILYAKSKKMEGKMANRDKYGVDVEPTRL